MSLGLIIFYVREFFLFLLQKLTYAIIVIISIKEQLSVLLLGVAVAQVCKT